MMATWTRRLVLATLLAGTAAISLARAQDDTLTRIRSAGVARIAMDLGAPPFGMTDESMQPTGSEVETARLLCADLGVKLEIVPVTSPARVPFLTTDKADMVIAVFGITDERKKVIAFSEPYAAVASVVAGPVDQRITGFADLVGKRVAATRGTTNDQELTRGAVRGTEIVRFEDDATSITALVSGQADFFASAPPLIETINRQRPAKPIEVKFVMRNFPYGVGLRQQDTALKAWTDGWVKANLKNGKLQAIYRKWHNLDLPPEVTIYGDK